MGEGNFFGESSLSSHDPTRVATVVADGPTTVLRLGRERFKLLFDTPLPQLMDRNLTRRVLDRMDLFKGMVSSK